MFSVEVCFLGLDDTFGSAIVCKSEKCQSNEDVTRENGNWIMWCFIENQIKLIDEDVMLMSMSQEWMLVDALQLAEAMRM